MSRWVDPTTDEMSRAQALPQLDASSLVNGECLAVHERRHSSDHHELKETHMTRTDSPTRPAQKSAMRRGRAAIWAAAAVVGVVAVGCGSQQLDVAKGERLIATQLAPRIGLKASEAKVACPDDLAIEKGAKFECTLSTPAGAKLRVRVEQTSDAGDVSFNFADGDPAKLLNTDKLKTWVTEKLAARFTLDAAAITVSCPGGVPLQSGGQLSCTANAEGQPPATVKLTQTDGEGEVEITGFEANS